MDAVVYRGPILNPNADGRADYHPRGALALDSSGKIEYIGAWEDRFAKSHHVELTGGVLFPGLIDCHIHIPQHPIRGNFTRGIDGNPPEGRLLAGLNKNVFPAEGCCSEKAYTELCVQEFLNDTLSKGTIGGVAYMTVHPSAVRAALRILPDTWKVGLVLMDQNCPEYLRTDAQQLERELTALAEDFGSQVIVTDRFAVACSTPLRMAGSKLAERLKLRTQTHLNEQRSEKEFVEKTLYPSYKSYTEVYQRDGLLSRPCLLAHCIHMRDDEWEIVASSGAAVVHCPVSNTLLGSGIMNLDEVRRRKIPWAICTDVGASPTTSLLTEMCQFLKVHCGRATVTPSEALAHTTVHAAKIAELPEMGRLEIGKPATFAIARETRPFESSEQAILDMVSFESLTRSEFEYAEQLAEKGLDAGEGLEKLSADVRKNAEATAGKIIRVVVRGQEVFRRP
jgi:guanine deaminase